MQLTDVYKLVSRKHRYPSEGASFWRHSGSCPSALRSAGWRGEWTRLAAGVEGTGFQVPSFVAELQVSRDPETCGAWTSGLRNLCWKHGLARFLTFHDSLSQPRMKKAVWLRRFEDAH